MFTLRLFVLKNFTVHNHVAACAYMCQLVFRPLCLCVCVHVPSASWKWNEAVVKSAAPGPARPKSYSVAFAPCSLCAARCLCLAFEMWW